MGDILASHTVQALGYGFVVGIWADVLFSIWLHSSSKKTDLLARAPASPPAP